MILTSNNANVCQLLTVSALSLILISMPVNASSKTESDKPETKYILVDKATNLVELLAVTELEDIPIGPGGFDARISTGRWLTANLSDCGFEVAKFARAWAKNYNLTVLSDYTSPKSVSINIGGDEIKGVFQLMYRLDGPPERAMLKFRFFTIDGLEKEPSISFQSYEIPDLSSNLREAMKCSID